MNKFLIILLGSVLSFSLAQAQMKCGAGKCGASMSQSATNSSLLAKSHHKDGYKVNINSNKPLVVGNNNIEVKIIQNGKLITDAKVKIKLFMPEMPGMPYMEYKEKLKLEDGSYRGVVNFSMSGTWQYHLKFKSNDGKVHKVRGSINI